MEAMGVNLTWSDCYFQINIYYIDIQIKEFWQGIKQQAYNRINPRNKSHISPTSGSMDRLPSILVLNINISFILQQELQHFLICIGSGNMQLTIKKKNI